jgi:hypothetical protein
LGRVGSDVGDLDRRVGTIALRIADLSVDASGHRRLGKQWLMPKQGKSEGCQIESEKFFVR